MGSRKSSLCVKLLSEGQTLYPNKSKWSEAFNFKLFFAVTLPWFYIALGDFSRFFRAVYDGKLTHGMVDLGSVILICPVRCLQSMVFLFIVCIHGNAHVFCTANASVPLAYMSCTVGSFSRSLRYGLCIFAHVVLVLLGL